MSGTSRAWGETSKACASAAISSAFGFLVPVSFYAFEMLYWCGIREGELLALTAADFNFEKETVRINKFYQRLHGEDVITTPKTKKSNRMIKMPKFLCEEMQEYLQMLYGLKKKDRIFTVTKNMVEVYIWICLQVEGWMIIWLV